MSRFKRNRSSGKRILLTLLLFLVVGGGASVFILFFEGKPPEISFQGTPHFMGQKSVVKYQVSDQGSGLRAVQIYGIQGQTKKLLTGEQFPRKGSTGSVGPLRIERELQFEPVKSGFKDGELIFEVVATDFSMRSWFAGNSRTVHQTVTIDTIPPHIQILHSESYISPGGTGIAIYRLSDPSSIHGVDINGHFNPGFPLGDGREDTFITYFALPYDAQQIDQLDVRATDEAGNSSVVAFETNLKNAVQRKDTINVGDGFLQTKIPEFQQYYPEMTGEFIDRYLYANGKIRVENNTKISELCNNPSPERFWKGDFARMPGSPRAGFADHRTYFYQGKPVDHQVHLGADIASTRRANVRAANSGKVIFADYMGIYGNMIMIDHGQGVFSLYSHLSQFNVAVGDMVDKKTIIGLTGTTGMAGGDHLHFSVLINGVFANPKEWWDPHWIEVTIEDPITDSKF